MRQKAKLFLLVLPNLSLVDIIRDADEQGQVYVAEPHVRDMLLPPYQRFIFHNIN